MEFYQNTCLFAFLSVQNISAFHHHACHDTQTNEPAQYLLIAILLFTKKNKTLISVRMASGIILLCVPLYLLIRTDVSVSNSVYYCIEVKNSMRLRFISGTCFSFCFCHGVLVWGMLIFGNIYNVVFLTVIHWHTHLSSCLPSTPYQIASTFIYISCFQSTLYSFSNMDITLQPDISKQKTNQLFVWQNFTIYYEQHNSKQQGTQNQASWPQLSFPGTHDIVIQTDQLLQIC